VAGFSISGVGPGGSAAEMCREFAVQWMKGSACGAFVSGKESLRKKNSSAAHRYKSFVVSQDVLMRFQLLCDGEARFTFITRQEGGAKRA
jgi:hypothetical protein